jgi:hypothetical protein
MPLTGFDGFHLIALPRDGLWRVSDWDEPFDPPPAPRPLDEVDPAHDEARRWDDPAGEFRTLYCATEAEGAFGEKLASFAPNTAVVQAIAAFLEDEPDDEFADDDLAGGLDAADIEAQNWKLAWAPADQECSAIDVFHPRTMVAAMAAAWTLLGAFLDRSVLVSRSRAVTRPLAGYLRDQAEDEAGDLRAAGIRYESRLGPAWECWALWEPFPMDISEPRAERVTIETPQLRAAAALLGVPLLH